MLEGVSDAEFEIGLGALHVVFEVGEGEFRLDHPEFGEVARGVGVFGAECGAKGVNIGEGAGHDFPFKLARNCEESGFAKKILGVIFPFSKSRHTEHLAPSLTVRSGNDGSLNVEKSFLLEKKMGCKSERISHSSDRSLRICSGAQVGDRPEKFK